MEFYDCYGDQLKIIEDENENIIDLVITEDCDDYGRINKAGFTLDRELATRLANFIDNKWRKQNESITSRKDEIHINDSLKDDITDKEIFALKMIELKNEYSDYMELVHEKMDDLMCDLLFNLGYTNAVDVFYSTNKWY